MDKSDEKRQTFLQWITHHEQPLFRFCYWRLNGRSQLAEEVVWETFHFAWTNMDTVHDDEGVGLWLKRIAFNKCRNLIRKESALRPTDPSVLEALLPDHGYFEPADFFSESERRQLRECIETLEKLEHESFSIVLGLTQLEEQRKCPVKLTWERIAHILSTRLGDLFRADRIRIVCDRAFKKLSKCMEDAESAQG